MDRMVLLPIAMAGCMCAYEREHRLYDELLTHVSLSNVHHIQKHNKSIYRFAIMNGKLYNL